MFYDYNDIVTIDELCEMLRIGKNTAYKLINSGEITSFKVGKVHKIPRQAIADYIIKNTSRT